MKNLTNTKKENSWLSQLQSKYLWLSFAAIFFFGVFKKPISNYLIDSWVTPIFSKVNESGFWVDAMIVVLFLISIYHIGSKTKDRLRPTINSTLIALTILFIYYIFLKLPHEFTFYSFKYFQCIDYWDIFIISVCIFTIRFKLFAVPLKKEATLLSFVEDSHRPPLDEDPQPKGYVYSLAQNINATTTNDTSFSIAIEGEWGSGKSYFMEQLKRILRDNKKENIICDFNPWRLESREGIAIDFFNTLAESLKPFDYSIENQLKVYSKAIIKTDAGKSLEFLEPILDKFITDASIQKQFKNISNSIETIGKRVIIFIDDVDRLTGEEIIGILKIIRSSANFPNVFFIVGIEYSYVVNVLKQTSWLYNEEKYLRKIFQLTIKRPPLYDEIENFIVEECFGFQNLSNEINTDYRRIKDAIDLLVNPKGDITNHINRGFLDKMIDNIRDLKRFANSFKIVFNATQGQVDVLDLMVLELIKTKNINLYNDLRNTENIFSYVTLGHSYFYGDEQKQYLRRTYSTDATLYLQAFDLLYQDSHLKNNLRFNNPRNRKNYFYYEIHNFIPHFEFYKVIKGSQEEIINEFKTWINSGYDYFAELRGIVSETIKFEDEETLKKVLGAFLTINANHYYQHHLSTDVLSVLFKVVINDDGIYLRDNNKKREFVLELLNKINIPEINRAELARSMMNVFVAEQKQVNEVITNKELEEIIVNLFQKFIDNRPKHFNEIFRFYEFNNFEIDPTHLANPKPVRLRFKEFLLQNDKVFIDFIMNETFFLSFSKFESYIRLGFKEHIKNIFEDFDTFNNRIDSLKIVDDKFSRLIFIIKNNIYKYFTEDIKEPELSNDDKNFVADYFGAL